MRACLGQGSVWGRRCPGPADLENAGVGRSSVRISLVVVQPCSPAPGEHRITLVRDEDDEKTSFTLPSFVEQGDELAEITLLVIRARQRWRELKGLGA